MKPTQVAEKPLSYQGSADKVMKPTQVAEKPLSYQGSADKVMKPTQVAEKPLSYQGSADKVMKPTQVAEKPLSYQGSGSGSRSRSRSGSCLGQNPIRSFVSGKRARLDDGFFIKIPPHLLADLGDEDSTDSEAEEEEKEGHGRLDSCLICGRIVRHHTARCPYLRLVPHNATLPPGVQRLCKCCGLRDGHPGRTDWKGFVVMKQCDNCGSYLEHWTDECPNKDRNDQ